MDALYILRILGSIGIFFHHVSFNVFGKTYRAQFVTFFFVLSGFCTAYSFRAKRFQFNKNLVTNYYKTKIIKLYPIYLITFLISIPIMIAYNVQYDVMDFILHLFMLQTYVFTGDKIIILNGVLWFVADIMFFYLISPFLYSLLKNQSIKIILIILTLIIGIQSLYPSICKSIGIYGGAYLYTH